jgi:hypothetical protein
MRMTGFPGLSSLFREWYCGSESLSRGLRGRDFSGAAGRCRHPRAKAQLPGSSLYSRRYYRHNYWWKPGLRRDVKLRGRNDKPESVQFPLEN